MAGKRRVEGRGGLVVKRDDARLSGFQGVFHNARVLTCAFVLRYFRFLALLLFCRDLGCVSGTGTSRKESIMGG
jgi:hypothetical protein